MESIEKYKEITLRFVKELEAQEAARVREYEQRCHRVNVALQWLYTFQRQDWAYPESGYPSLINLRVKSDSRLNGVACVLVHYDFTRNVEFTFMPLSSEDDAGDGCGNQVTVNF